MSEKRMDQISDDGKEHGRSGLKKAVIVFAIIEALVIIPVILYLMFR